MKIWEINSGDQQVNDLLCSFGDEPQDGLWSLNLKSLEVCEHDTGEWDELLLKSDIVLFQGDGEVLS